MGKIRKLVDEMFDSTLSYGYKKRDKLIENIFNIAHSLGNFVIKNMDVIMDVFSAADDILIYNSRYGTDFGLSIHGFLSVEVFDNGDKVMEFISNKGIALNVLYKGDIGKIIPRIEIKDSFYMIDTLDYYRNKFKFHGFNDIENFSVLVSEYMEMFTKILNEKNVDGNIESLFVDKIMSFSKNGN